MRQWLYLVLMRCLNGLNTWVHDRVLLGAVSYKLSFFPFHMTLTTSRTQAFVMSGAYLHSDTSRGAHWLPGVLCIGQDHKLA